MKWAKDGRSGTGLVWYRSEPTKGGDPLFRVHDDETREEMWINGRYLSIVKSKNAENRNHD